MYIVGIVGCGILLFHPYVQAFVVCLMKGRPQLVLCALLSATCALVPSVLTSLIYLAWPASWRWSWPVFTPAASASRPSTASLAGSVGLLVLHNLLQFLVRASVCWGMCGVQSWLRRGFDQVIVFSSYRLALVSLAVGLGFGFTSAVLLGGALWLDAALRTASSTPGVTAYNVDVCPQMPTLFHASLQAFLLTCCHAAWGVMTGQALAAVHTLGPRVFYALVCAHSTQAVVLPINDATHVHKAPREAPSEADSAAVQPTATQSGNAVATDDSKPTVGQTREEADEAAPASPGDTLQTRSLHLQRPRGPHRTSAPPPPRAIVVLPADTRLVDHPRVACATLLAVAALQLLFSLLPLFHSAAMDSVAGVERAARGCVVSLPLQLVITATSVLYALWLLRVEHVKLS